jgi:hypothetical protein
VCRCVCVNACRGVCEARTLVSVLHDHIRYQVVELHNEAAEALLVCFYIPGAVGEVGPIDAGVVWWRNQEPCGVRLNALLRWLGGGVVVGQGSGAPRTNHCALGLLHECPFEFFPEVLWVRIRGKVSG